MPYIDLNKIKTESHWTNKLKDGAKRVARTVVEKTTDAIMFVKDNPQAAAIILGGAGTLIGVAKKVSHSIDMHSRLKKERYNKERYIYDHSLNMYLKTKRPLKKDDYRRINQKRKEGKRLSEIFQELDLLD